MLNDILAAHFAAYPLTEPADAVKLVFQNEFGPGHLIGGTSKSLTRLELEISTLTRQASDNRKEPLYESIGEGLCRLNLRPCVQRGIPTEMVNRLFCEAGARVRGDGKRFLKKLQILTQMAEADAAPFSPAELDYYLILYREKGCPAVHHSDAYRAAYAPAYRVVLQKQLKDQLSALRVQTSV